MPLSFSCSSNTSPATKKPDLALVKKIILTPKSIIRRELGLALRDVKKGRLSPIFTTAAEGIRWLDAEAKKSRSRKRTEKMA